MTIDELRESNPIYDELTFVVRAQLLSKEELKHMIDVSSEVYGYNEACEKVLLVDKKGVRYVNN